MKPHPPPQSGPVPLEDAVLRWLKVVLRRLAIDFRDKANAVAPTYPEATPRLLVSEEEQEHLLDVGKSLGESRHFRDASLLAQFLMNSLAAILHESPLDRINPDKIAARLAERLKAPVVSFRFRAPLALRDGLSFSVILGGQNELKIEPSDQAGQAGMTISGMISSPTESAAIAGIEDILESILGVCLAIDLCSMLSPLPGENPILHLEMTPHAEEIPTHLGPVISAGVSGAVFRIPKSNSDLETRHIEAGEYERGLERYIRQLSRLVASEESRAAELRHAGALLLRASVTTDLGLALTYAFMCLEAVLLEKSTTDNVLSRLTEAMAYRIGTSATHRVKLRREIKDLYNLRSRYVHTGNAGALAWTRPRERCLEIVACVLLREIEEASS